MLHWLPILFHGQFKVLTYTWTRIRYPKEHLLLYSGPARLLSSPEESFLQVSSPTEVRLVLSTGGTSSWEFDPQRGLPGLGIMHI